MTVMNISQSRHWSVYIIVYIPFNEFFLSAIGSISFWTLLTLINCKWYIYEPRNLCCKQPA